MSGRPRDRDVKEVAGQIDGSMAAGASARQESNSRSRVAINRRTFLACAVSLAGQSAQASKKAAYAFATAEYDVDVTVDFHDHYATGSFSFRDLSAGSNFCLPMIGEKGPDCASGFVGALAVARYRFQTRSGRGCIAGLREHVRTIDQDALLPYRPPFDRTIKLHDGVATDIQAFGYEVPASYSSNSGVPGSRAPWYYFRQELYLDERSSAFIVVHWRHTLDAIRILDVIPGKGTLSVKRPE